MTFTNVSPGYASAQKQVCLRGLFLTTDSHPYLISCHSVLRVFTAHGHETRSCVL